MNNISKEDLDFLKELSKEMNTQDKRYTSHVMFMVYDEVKVYCGDWGNETERKDEIEESYLCEECLKKYENDGDLPDHCDECDSDLYVQFNWELQPCDEDGVFFTAKECDEYIEDRRYNFNKPCSYGISMYRSCEMRRVMNIISKLTLEEGQKNPLP